MKSKLSFLYFLQFSIWGSYLTSLGQFLGSAGLGKDIAWFYASVGFVALLMPALIGHLADRYISPRRMLSLCHAVASIFMLSAWCYSEINPVMQFTPFFLLYLGFLAFYMPTVALANTNSFLILHSAGEDTLKAFPRIRIFGTVGFVAAMWFVNSFYMHDGSLGFTLTEVNPMSNFRLQYTSGQLLCSGILGIITALYSLILPDGTVLREVSSNKKSLMEITGWKRFKLFRRPQLRTFLIFAVLGGVCLQISNGYVTPFITHFAGLKEYMTNPVASNATMLFSISQIAEAGCILLVGVALKRFGIKTVLIVAMNAWALRFGALAIGNPGSGLWLFIISMISYGIAFNFFNIAGALYIDQHTANGGKGFGQGVLMLMANGLGATVGMLGAGEIVNHFCRWLPIEVEGVTRSFFMGDWTTVWLIFAIYSISVAIALSLFFQSRIHHGSTNEQ